MLDNVAQLRHNTIIGSGNRQLLNNCEADTMNKSELFKAAHTLAKSVIKAGDNYRVTFGAALKMILSESVKATFIVEYNDSWNGFCKQEIEATSHKEAMQIFESKNRRKCFSVSKNYWWW